MKLTETILFAITIMIVYWIGIYISGIPVVRSNQIAGHYFLSVFITVFASLLYHNKEDI